MSADTPANTVRRRILRLAGVVMVVAAALKLVEAWQRGLDITTAAMQATGYLLLAGFFYLDASVERYVRGKPLGEQRTRVGAFALACLGVALIWAPILLLR